MPFKSVGDVILGYRLLSEPQLSGQSKWAFVEKEGKEYFIKQFLSPVQPSTGEPGSTATYNKKKLAAEKFEKRHSRMNEIASSTHLSENLVVPFRVGWVDGKYTKISVKVNAIDVSVEDIVKLSIEKRAMIMLQLSEALRTLHQHGIVHSDIKWTNILFERTEGGVKPRLIDFDAGYSITDRPVDPDDITFDAPYAAPEVWKFIRSGAIHDGAMIGLHSDVFSLGILFHEISCGKKPLDDKAIPYGQHLLTFGPSVSLSKKSKFFNLVSGMLKFEANQRPSIQDVIDNLSELLGLTTVVESNVSVESVDRQDFDAEKSVSISASETAKSDPLPDAEPRRTSGLKGLLVRAIGRMWGGPARLRVSKPTGKPPSLIEPTVVSAPTAASSTLNGDDSSNLKVSSSFASKEVERIAGDRVKVTFPNRSDREVRSIIKTSARVVLPEESKVKTTIKR